MKKTQNQSFQVIPLAHPRLGTVYTVKHGNEKYGPYANKDAAERQIKKLCHLMYEMQVIKNSAEMEFEIEL